MASHLTVDLPEGRLNVRAAGICLHDAHVLIHRDRLDRFWTLPGGRPHLFESTSETLGREWREELRIGIAIVRLVWVAETTFWQRGRRWHEIGLYYLVAPESGWDKLGLRDEFRGLEEDEDLIFRWQPLSELDGEINGRPLEPAFLRRGLVRPPSSVTHVATTGDERLHDGPPLAGPGGA